MILHLRRTAILDKQLLSAFVRLLAMQQRPRVLRSFEQYNGIIQHQAYLLIWLRVYHLGRDAEYELFNNNVTKYKQWSLGIDEHQFLSFIKRPSFRPSFIFYFFSIVDRCFETSAWNLILSLMILIRKLGIKKKPCGPFYPCFQQVNSHASIVW